MIYYKMEDLPKFMTSNLETFTLLQTCIALIPLILICATNKYVKRKITFQAKPLGEEFIGYTIRKYFKADNKVLEGIIVEYMPPSDGENGFDWWVHYEDGEMETMDLREIFRYVQV